MDKGIRINQYIAKCGLASRRKSEGLILDKQIKINGNIANLGDKVNVDDVVTYLGERILPRQEEVWIAIYKPRGIICTSSVKEKPNIIEYLNYESHIFPVGRLDKDSEGLLLLTTNGTAANRLAKARYYHEKEYIVRVNKKLEPHIIKKLEEGVPILDTVTRPCQIKMINHHTFKIILTQGLNRQIRRMCEYYNYKVTSLKRIRIMNITLGNLKYGQHRQLTKPEIELLTKELKGE